MESVCARTARDHRRAASTSGRRERRNPGERFRSRTQDSTQPQPGSQELKAPWKTCSARIDELRWRTNPGRVAQTNEPILQRVAMKFNLNGISDAAINAIRIFYTSPIDALLLGSVLIRKSESS
jgi:hypothetical protein